MSSKYTKGRKPITYQALLEENQLLSDENHTLKNEIESLRARLAVFEELKSVEDRLRESESRYRMFFTNMSEGFLLGETICDNNGKPCDYLHLEINPAYELDMGVRKEQVSGKSLLEVFPDADLLQIEKFCKVALSGQSTHFDIFSNFAGKHFEVYAFCPEKGKFAAIFRDITERKQLEDALKRSEENLNNLLSSIQDGFFELDRDWRFTYINQRAARNGNFEPEELIGECIWEKFPYMTSSKLGEMYNEVMKTRRSAHFEINSSIMDRWYGVNVYPSASGISVFWTDITERKKTEEALKESEELYRSIAKNLPNGTVYVFDHNLRYLVAEGEALERIGWSREQLEGKSVYDLDEETRKIVEPRYRSVLAGESFVFETPYRGRVMFSQYVPIRNDKGEIFAGLVLGLDITERKLVEEKLKQALVKAEEGDQLLAALMEYVPVGITIADTSGQLRMVSQYGEKLLGGAHADRSVGEVVDRWTVYQPDGTTPIDIDDVPLVKAIQKGEVVRDVEILQLNTCGDKLFLLCNAAPIRDPKGNVIGGIVAWNDITERKQLEEEIRQRAEELELVMDVAPAIILIGHDPQSHNITGNRMANEFYGAEVGENISASVADERHYFREGCELIADELPMQEASQKDVDISNAEYDVLFPGGECRSLLGSASPLHDAEGYVRGSVGAFIDITERKKAEGKLKETLDNLDKLAKERTADLQKAYDSLKESEKDLADAQKTSHLGNWKWSFEINILHWSDEVYRIFGLKPQEFEVTYDLFLNYVHPDDRAYVDNSVKKALNGNPFDIDFRITSSNGKERIVNAKCDIIFDKNNIPAGIRGTIQDITDRKQAEKALRESEERIQLANQVASIGTYSYDFISGESYWSPELKSHWGMGPDDPVVLDNDLLIPCLHPEDRQMFLTAMNKANDPQGNGVLHLEYRVKRPDGSDRWLRVHGQTYFIGEGADRHPYRVYGAVIDITERKQAEEALHESESRFRNLFEVISSGVIIYDVIDDGRDFIFRDINPAGERIDHVQRENIIGKSLYEFFPNVGEMGLDEAFRRVWHTGKTEFFPLTLYEDDRISLWVINYIYKLPSGELVAVFEDITERKQAEGALEKLETARKKEIHHRIKNNLQVISSLLDLQAEQFRYKECIKDFEVLDAFRESQDRVISMALIHEELYKGGGFETLNFAPYIQKLAENLFQTYKLGNTDVNLKMDLAENIFFDMDIAVPLGIVINELVSNSLKHAFIGRCEGEIRIKLHRERSKEYENEDCNSSNFVLTVSDNGAGIPENLDIEDIDTLGMQLVTTLIDQLDGEFELKIDNGTEFIIRFEVTEKYNQTTMPGLQ